jgi:hypothetical protein
LVFTTTLKKILSFLLVFVLVIIRAQADSISIRASLSENKRQLSVHQEIVFHTKNNAQSDSLKLLNWVAAYQSKNTPLAKRKLEDRNSEMYFARQEDFGKLLNLTINIGERTIKINALDAENIFIPLSKLEMEQKSILFSMDYTITLPSSKFTSYGADEKSVLLKYFFIVPDQVYKNEARNYLDIEERTNFQTFWDIQLDLPEGVLSYSNLAEIHKNHFSSLFNSDPEIFISKEIVEQTTAAVEGKTVLVQMGYPMNPYEKSRVDADLPKHLLFLKNAWGFLPEKIFISEKFKSKENFFGNDDIHFWKFKFPLFASGEVLDMDYFSILSKKYVEQALVTDKEKQHWLTNGLKSYLENQYLKKYYPQAKLLGNLPETFRIFGLKPLKWFNASELKLTDRYGLAYQYMVSQNLDQAIATPFSKMSNFNDIAISSFETGSLFNFLSEKIKTTEFDGFMTGFISKYNHQLVATDTFFTELYAKSKTSSDFMETFVENKQRVGFKIHGFKRKNKNLLVDITKNTDLPIPFRIQTETLNKPIAMRQYWFETTAKKSREIYIVPDSAVSKITINNNYFFPESNIRDNYLYTKGLFSNTKKIKFKLIKDIPNPEFHEIYLNPKLNFNIYDEVLLGLNFSNSSFINSPFLYSFTPYYSTGTTRVTGSGAVSYSFLPANSFFNSWSLGLGASYFHYSPTLAYRKVSAATSMLFSKNPRSSISKSIFASYTYFQKDLDAQMQLNNEYDKYNIWSLGYGFSDRKLIHEKSLGISLQGMEDYTKLTAEAFYRWEYAANKKISFRLFAGAFLYNNTRNNLFDFGISRVSNYSFSYGLFGQGETDGFWSQQFVLAEGGFKSFFPNTANQWISSVNIDAHAWKMFNLYTDFGVFNSRGIGSQFIWDSGVKLKIIPDFLEIYFPVQSSLGFEPAKKDYANRIRFSVSFNLNSIIGSARRGWF